MSNMSVDGITSDAVHEKIHLDQDLAVIANQEEHATTKWQAIKKQPWTFLWCLYAVWTVVLVSFENTASGASLSIPEFRKDYGSFYNGDYVLDAKWQAAFNGGPIASQVLGALFGGQVADWIGRRKAIMAALVITFGAVTMEFVATTNELFFGGKFLNGFAVGTIQACAGTYIGEIVPLALRGMMTCAIALAYTIGPFTVAVIINSTGSYANRWAYRFVFCSQYGFAGVAALFIWFMPESPWWLANKGREDQALRSLQRLGYSSAMGDDSKTLAHIRLTLDELKQEAEGVTYLECFRKSNLRRTIVSFAPLVFQQLTGVYFAASYSIYYAQLAGYSTSMSFKLQIIQQLLGMFGSVVSWCLIDRIGRRDLTIYGTVGLMVLLWIMGGLAVGGSVEQLEGCIAMMLIYFWGYNVSIGATAYTCLIETAAPRLRVKTIAIGLAVSNCFVLVFALGLPFLFNPDQANLGGKVGFIFGGLCVPCIAFLWCFQPETKARSYKELDEMFTKKIPARRFSSYVTDVQMQSQNLAVAMEKS